MPVVGLVLTLSEDPGLAEQVLGWLARDGRFTAGARFGRRLPVVMDTPDREADEDAWRDLAGVPGVTSADVIFAGVADENPSDPVEMVRS